MSPEKSGRPHLLYVAFAFPPSTASSVYRGLAVPNAFAAAGWDVTVLTIDGEIWSEISGADLELTQSIDARIVVEHISDGGAEDPAKGDIREFSRLRMNAPFLWRWLLSRRSRKLFPEQYHGLWLPVATNAVRRIHQEHPVDLVMATASPYVSFAVATKLPGVPYVLDYRDAWAFHTFSGVANFAPTSSTAKLEAQYLDGAEQVWFVNGPIRDEYARLYPGNAGKMRVVPNGFDPQPGHARSTPRPTEHPTFGYLGTIPHVKTPLKELLDGWAHAFGITKEGDRPTARAIIRGKLSSSGRVDSSLLAKFDESRRHGLEYAGPVSKRYVPSFYQSLDALILLLPSGQYVTGGKTSEYLATGLPIVSVHDLANATTDMLRDYPLWFPAEDLSVEAVAKAFRACADSLRNPDPARWDAAWEYGQRFLRSRMLDPVIDELTQRLAPGHPVASVQGALHPSVPQSGTEGPNFDERRPIRGMTAGQQGVAPISVLALITAREGVESVISDLLSRLASISGPEIKLTVVSVDGHNLEGVSRTITTGVEQPLEKLAGRLATVAGPVGILGRLGKEILASTRIAKAVAADKMFSKAAEAASVVVATDTRGIRSVWTLRDATDANLVFGPVAMVHALQKLRTRNK